MNLTPYQTGYAHRLQATSQRFAYQRNPYPAGSIDARQWVAGWRDACQLVAARRMNALRGLPSR